MTAPFVWAPSGQRVIALFAGATDKRPGRPLAELPLRWADHAADAVLDYTLDATLLRADASDPIAVESATTQGIALGAVLVHGASVTMWLGPATVPAGSDGLINMTLTTGSGRRVNRIARLRIA